ncbi:MAG: hypothetical protein CVT92_07785 [Bacteroidetes bacterium HGW-Bacteroidetes-1]|jgi:PAS domain S-box-containing protein|nr:MAG: hypothetical protein CVT92_07785 [Bacteroidetes bacterium HGW-Bacteroidetes-1]
MNKRTDLMYFMFVFILLFHSQSFAQQVERPLAISAYIYNFAKNVEWENEKNKKEFHFLMIGQDESVLHELNELAKTKTLRNKPIRISNTIRLKNTDKIDLIFITEKTEEELVDVFDRIEGKNILLISDHYPDKRLIMINFFDSEEGTLQFEINKANIINQKLRVMQDMILLGGTEIDVAALYLEGQQNLRSQQKTSEKLTQDLQRLEINLSQLEKAIEERNKEALVIKDSLALQNLMIVEQQKVLKSQSFLLQVRENELKRQIQKIEERQKIFDLQQQNIDKQTADLETGNKTLKLQKDEIERQQDEITAQKRILQIQDLKIDRQRSLMYVLVFLILLVGVLGFSLLIAFRNKQKLNKELESRVDKRTNELNDSNKQLLVELTERKMAEKRLIESENKYRTLLENLPQKIFFKNSDLIFVSCNENFAKELHVHPSEIEGKSDYDFFSKEIADKYRKDDADFLAEGKLFESEMQIHRDGKTFWTQIIKVPVKDENGYVVGVQGIFWDITKRKEIEIELKKHRLHLEEMVKERTSDLLNANQRLKAIFDATNVGIVVLKDRIVLQCNSKLEEIFGYAPDEMFGKPTRVWYNDEADYAIGGSANERVRLGETHQREQKLKKKNGETFFARLTGSAIDPNDPSKGMVAVIEDVTIEREKEASLKKALETAESADQLKSAFLATMSHELRTPLNSIIGFTGMLLQELPGPLNDEQKKQLKMTQKSGRHLLSLINDVLDLSKIEAGQLKLSTDKFQISDVIENVIELSIPFAISRNLSLFATIEPDLPVILSDQFRIQQVIINLVNNALKFTERGSINVKAFFDKSYVVVNVVDTGPGIEAEQIKTLFRPFIQIDSGVARKHDGTGLGLSISKKLMTMLGGTIGVNSEPGKGSTFFIKIPVSVR